MPCTAPPSSWPRTIIGLTTRPTSLTDAYATTATWPVCGSISTSLMWQPLGHDGPATAVTDSMKMRCSLCRAASAKRSMLKSVPATLNWPLAYSMSCSAASSSLAASCLAVAIVRSAPTCSAEPPVNSEREPALPKPSPRSVSPMTTLIFSIGTPNASTISCASEVPMPWPMALTAVKTSMIPSEPGAGALISRVTRSSSALPPVHSKKVEMPRPRNSPRRAESAARASKSGQSASTSA